jgi:tRNA nucleotidyltransferase (CCA-adding enzyme)
LKTERKAQKIKFEDELVKGFTKPLTWYPKDRADVLPSPLIPSLEKEWFGDVKIYLVGGAVREIVRGFPEKVKDWDFAIEAKDYDTMAAWIKYQGFEVFVETPQYMTIRARASKPFWFAGMDMSGRTFDFALCRTDGEYSDGRRPDTVSVANLESDLSRREFSMNAMAMGTDGEIIDLHGGRADIEAKEIKLVGGVERLREDPLRMLRALRFSIQLGFYIDDEIWSFMYFPDNAALLEKVDTNRIRDELTKCFKMDTMETLLILQGLPFFRDYIFKETPIWLEPTVKGK